MHGSIVRQDANATNTYEVQGFSAGEWRTLCVCLTSAEAMHEVADARCDRQYLGIRVTVETYDQTARKYFSRVVYHYSPLTVHQPPVAKVVQFPAVEEVRRTAPAKPLPVEAADFLTRNTSDWMMTARLAVVVGVTAVAVMALGF